MRKRKKIDSSTIVLSTIIVFFTIIIFLSLPVFFNYKSLQNEIENKFFSNFKINLKILDNISFRVLPRPHLLIKKANLDFNLEDKKLLKKKLENNKKKILLFHSASNGEFAYLKPILKKILSSLNTPNLILYGHHKINKIQILNEDLNTNNVNEMKKYDIKYYSNLNIKIFNMNQIKRSKIDGFFTLLSESIKCKNSEFDDNPEVTAYLQVKDLTNKNKDDVFVFNGWMFSSSPSITPFDHPVYDIWLISCY